MRHLAANRRIGHDVIISGRKVNMRLDQETWRMLDHIACTENMTMESLLTEIDRNRVEGSSLNSAVNTFVIAYAMADLTARADGELER